MEEKHGEILIYQTENGLTDIEVKMQDETVWLTQQQLVELYQSSKSNISEHIKHIFEERELDEEAVVRKFRTTASDGKKYNTTYYKLKIVNYKLFQNVIEKEVNFLFNSIVAFLIFRAIRA